MEMVKSTVSESLGRTFTASVHSSFLVSHLLFLSPPQPTFTFLIFRLTFPFWICFFCSRSSPSFPSSLTSPSPPLFGPEDSSLRRSALSDLIPWSDVPLEAGHISISGRSQLITALWVFPQLAVFGVWWCLGASLPGNPSPSGDPPVQPKTPPRHIVDSCQTRLGSTIYPPGPLQVELLAVPSYCLSIASHGAAKLMRMRPFSSLPAFPSSPQTLGIPSLILSTLGPSMTEIPH